MKKIKAFKHFNTQYAVEDYSEMYKKLRFDLRYPPNIKRLEIFTSLLKNFKLILKTTSLFRKGG